MMLVFDVYCVRMQVNAAAYLAGRVRPLVPGTDPPDPFTSDLAAVTRKATCAVHGARERAPAGKEGGHMLTVDVTAMRPGEHQLWVIEADLEYGTATAGLAGVHLARDGSGSLYVESDATGGCYTEPAPVGQVEVWSAEEHVIALFPAEEAMRAGGQQLAGAYGRSLPVGVHRVLTALAGDLEAGR